MTMKVLLALLIALCSQVQGLVIIADERTCLPQPSAVVPIQGSVKKAAGLALCDANSGKLTGAFSEFLSQEIVKTFHSLSKNCILSNVQEEYCENHGRNNRRISFKFNASLTCGDGCDSEHSSDQQALELINSKHNDLRAVFRTKSSAEVQYVGKTVVLHYFHGKKGAVSVNCETSVVRSVKKYPLCECPESCSQGNTQTVPELCTLPPVTGLCRAAIPRYFYNSTSQQCEMFVYGGCGGNDNNFDTEKDCQSECKVAGKKPECPNGKEHRDCGSSCPARCSTRGKLIPCTLQCVPGCFCPRGMFELGDECVSEDQCPTESPATVSVTDKECPKGKVFRECGSSCPKTCDNKNPLFCTLQCVRGCFCPPNMFELGDECVSEDQCPTESPATVSATTEHECPEGMEYSSCGSSCPKTCENKDKIIPCTAQCVQGCFCPADKVLSSGRCIPANECE